MIGEESVNPAAGNLGLRDATQVRSAATAAQEDDGPIHGSTPPHGDIFGHQIANDLHEFEEDAEEQPVTRS